MDLYLRNLCVNDLTVLLFSLFNSKSIADASFVRKMADDHVNIDKYERYHKENCVLTPNKEERRKKKVE